MSFIPAGLTRFVGRAILKTQKNAPTILFAAGAVGVVATAVSAVKQTAKFQEVLAKHEEGLETASYLLDQNRDDYTQADYEQDLMHVRIHFCIDTVKVWVPTVLLGAGTIACFAGAHHILSKRNAALAAAYNVLQESYDKYRQRVRDDQGSSKDLEYRFGRKEREVVEETDQGPKKTLVSVPEGATMYARIFDEGCAAWSPQYDYNVVYLNGHQNMMNDLLQARGHVFLNEVYDALGFDRTKEGSVVGWLRDANTGDGYIDFNTVHYVDRGKNVALLDFNVDGTIWDRI